MADASTTPKSSATSLDSPSDRRTNPDFELTAIRSSLRHAGPSDPGLDKDLTRILTASSQSLEGLRPSVIVSDDLPLLEYSEPTRPGSTTYLDPKKVDIAQEQPADAPATPQHRPGFPLWVYFLFAIAGILFGWIFLSPR